MCARLALLSFFAAGSFRRYRSPRARGIPDVQRHRRSEHRSHVRRAFDPDLSRRRAHAGADCASGRVVVDWALRRVRLVVRGRVERGDAGRFAIVFVDRTIPKSRGFPEPSLGARDRRHGSTVCFVPFAACPMRRMSCTGAGIEPAGPCAGAHQSGAVPSSPLFLTSASRARTSRAVSLADRPPSSSLGYGCRARGRRARARRNVFAMLPGPSCARGGSRI